MARKYKKLSDDDILSLILTGSIVVDVETGAVSKPDRRRGGTQFLPTEECDNKYLHVRIYHNGGRRSIVVHKLVWMTKNSNTVPAGHELDHDDTNRQNNHWSNLILKDAVQHRSESGKRAHQRDEPGEDYVDPFDEPGMAKVQEDVPF